MNRIAAAFSVAGMASMCVALPACTPDPQSPAVTHGRSVSSTLALNSDDSALWVVNPDADSISLVDPRGRSLVAEIPLGDAPPTVDAEGRYEPRIKPRALALLPGDKKVYVAAQTANQVIVLDAATRRVTAHIAVPVEPVSVVASHDGKLVYVVSYEAGLVTRIDAATDRVLDSVAVGEHPWGAALSDDGKLLFVTRFLLDPGLTVIATDGMTVSSRLTLAAQPFATSGRKVPNGEARGLYAVVPRPSDGQLWVPHLLLATHTAQPQLDFESTVFPTVSTITPDGKRELARLLFKPLAVPGAGGAFSDSVSGPRALAFSPDGKLALLALADSEDVMVFDAASGNELALVRPLPGAFLEGIVVDDDSTYAYVNGRNTHDVTVLRLHTGDPTTPATVDGSPINLLAQDPMPPELRLGQRLFYSANSAMWPITKNFWVSCASCHLEGATDAVTWRFKVGPRDTPSNAGGPLHTGFLLHQGLRSSVAQYDLTINDEQGGDFHRDSASQMPLLDALAGFVNRAIVLPQNPNRQSDGKLTASQARGGALFAARCASCHAGAWYTDSGAGNATLDLSGPIVLHDVGTCVTTGDFVDQAAPDDVLGKMHAACAFDTPSLRGVFASAPYLHDGSAATLGDAIARMPGSADLSATEKADLLAFVQQL